MTNRLELNWKLDGFVDEQRYYCSETPIDVTALPPPKAVLSSETRSYTDLDVESNKTYYIRLSSVKNSIEKLSNEVTVKTSSLYQRSTFSIWSANTTGIVLSDENRKVDIGVGVQDRRWVGVNTDHVATQNVKYIEITLNNLLNSFDRFEFGLSTNGANTTYTGKYLINGLGKKKQGSTAAVGYASAFVIGDKIGVSIQDVNGSTQIIFYKNGVSLGIAFTIASVSSNFRPFIAYNIGSGSNYQATATIVNELSEAAKKIENLEIW